MHQLLLEEFEERHSPFPVFEVTWGSPIFCAQDLKAPQECTVFTMVYNRNHQSKPGLRFEAVVGRKIVSRKSRPGLQTSLSLPNNKDVLSKNFRTLATQSPTLLFRYSTLFHKQRRPTTCPKNASKRTRPCSHRNTIVNAHKETRFIVVLHSTKNSHLYT